MLGTAVMLLPEGSVPVNGKVIEIINIVKPQAIELIDYANNVRSELSLDCRYHVMCNDQQHALCFSCVFSKPFLKKCS